MSRRNAVLGLLIVCLLLAILLIAKVISPLIGGILFSVALVFFGLISGGFTKGNPSSK